MATKTNQKGSALHNVISKDSSRLIITVSIAVFIVTFCLVASRALIGQMLYQNKVISEKKDTLKVINENEKAAQELAVSYVAFAGESVNVIGGNPTGTGPKDGDNAKLVLDSLPDIFDYPALSTSIEKILLDGGYSIQSIGGADTATTELDVDSVDSSTAVAVSAATEIPYSLRVATTPESALSLLQTLENSIRPFQIKTLKLEGSSNNLEVDISMKTYYQLATGLQTSTKVVK